MNDSHTQVVADLRKEARLTEIWVRVRNEEVPGDSRTHVVEMICFRAGMRKAYVRK
jgi:hypothetical protein